MGGASSTAVLHSVTGPAARRERRSRHPLRSDRAFAIPPLIPRARTVRRARASASRAHAPSCDARGRGAGHAWRRAWIACLVYERFRYALLHPESRFPGHTIPPSEVLRMVNDCISPLDLVRDWPLVRGQ